MIKFNALFEQSVPYKWQHALLAVGIYFGGYLVIIPEITGLVYALGLINENTVYLFNGGLIGGLLVLIMFTMRSLSHENMEQWRRTKQFQEILRHMLYLYLSLLAVNALLGLVTEQLTSENQAIIMEAFKQAPLYIVFVAVVFAPIVEEILFRGIIYRTLRFFKLKWIAIVISSASFGLIHVYDSWFNARYEDLWFIFVYMTIGFFLNPHLRKKW
ncbi:MAG: CPBP family intramembrane metalloprotease [Erysipelotrichaceae bacterium]|nr:CPBP family intramembrane metalloprotease [Erysipelotrichaceae bacterium]